MLCARNAGKAFVVVGCGQLSCQADTLIIRPSRKLRFPGKTRIEWKSLCTPSVIVSILPLLTLATSTAMLHLFFCAKLHKRNCIAIRNGTSPQCSLKCDLLQLRVPTRLLEALTFRYFLEPVTLILSLVSTKLSEVLLMIV